MVHFRVDRDVPVDGPDPDEVPAKVIVDGTAGDSLSNSWDGPKNEISHLYQPASCTRVASRKVVCDSHDPL